MKPWKIWDLPELIPGTFLLSHICKKFRFFMILDVSFQKKEHPNPLKFNTRMIIYRFYRYSNMTPDLKPEIQIVQISTIIGLDFQPSIWRKGEENFNSIPHHSFLGGLWQLNYFWIMFTPKLGEMIQFDELIFFSKELVFCHQAVSNLGIWMFPKIGVPTNHPF